MSNWYPRYYGDYMRDTSHLPLIEHGAYVVMLDHYYATGKALPTDDATLFRICRAFAEEERAAVLRVKAAFFRENGDGLLHNKRADRELAKQGAISMARAAAGAKGASKKWDGKRDGKQMANATTSTSTSTTIEPHPAGAGGDARARGGHGDDGLRWTEAECIAAGDRTGVAPDLCRAFFAHYAAVGFVDAAGRPFRSLPHAIQRWAANEPTAAVERAARLARAKADLAKRTRRRETIAEQIEREDREREIKWRKGQT